MIRKMIKVLLLATALSSPGLANATTLSESINSAIELHPKMAAGKAARDAAGKTLKEQHAGYFPVISLQSRAGRINANDDTTRAATGGDASSWLGEGSLTVTQPLFSGFSTVNRVEAAKSRIQAAEQEISGEAEDVAMTAARAHLNLMRTRELLDIASKYMTDIQKRRDSIKLMVSEGAADEAELLQAEEILMAAKTTRLGFEESYRQAEASYIEAIGTTPASELEFGPSMWDKLIPPTIDEAITIAKSNNPKILSAEQFVLALGKDTAAERSELMPKFDAEMSYLKKDQDDNLGGELSNAQAMLKMSWNFSTGGAQLARIDRGLDQQAEAKARQQEALRGIEYAVRQKYTSMQIVDQQYVLYTDRQKANEKIVENLVSQFEAGKQSNLQLINANARLFDSRSSRTDAYYRQLLSRFELLGAMGKMRTAFTATPVAQK